MSTLFAALLICAFPDYVVARVESHDESRTREILHHLRSKIAERKERDKFTVTGKRQEWQYPQQNRMTSRGEGGANYSSTRRSLSIPHRPLYNAPLDNINLDWPTRVRHYTRKHRFRGIYCLWRRRKEEPIKTEVAARAKRERWKGTRRTRVTALPVTTPMQCAGKASDRLMLTPFLEHFLICLFASDVLFFSFPSVSGPSHAFIFRWVAR